MYWPERPLYVSLVLFHIAFYPEVRFNRGTSLVKAVFISLFHPAPSGSKFGLGQNAATKDIRTAKIWRSSTCCSGRTKIGRTCCHDTEKTLKYSIKTDIEPLMFCVSTPSWVFKGSRCIQTGNVWGLTFNSIIND